MPNEENIPKTTSQLSEAQLAQQEAETLLIGIEGVVGVGIAKDETSGDPYVVVFVKRETAALRKTIPTSIRQLPVVIKKTDTFRFA